jgi:hypothetical protein
MEILKSSLKQIPEADRVKGRVYGVGDVMDWHLVKVAIFNNGNKDISGSSWKFWFELPESMLPVREVEVMPDEFELKQGEWEYDSPLHECWSDISKLTRAGSLRFRRFKVISTNPAQSLTIPAGTKADQLEFLRGVIATMEGGGV